LGVCAVSDDESAALHRDIVKLTWTTATLAAGTGVLACASSAWQAGLVGGRICKNLQSDSTFAWQHREIRNELPHLEATLVIYKVSGAPHSFTASA
jgi:hypothetical protein